MHIKQLISRILNCAIANRLVWFLATVIACLTHGVPGQIRCYQYLLFLKYQLSRDYIDSQLRLLFPYLVVSSGPFKGLKYTNTKSIGSTIFPKLLGTYESELFSSLFGLLANDYDEVYDIGCAEGYYAVGVALKCPRTKVVAFDVNASARTLCRQLAEVNEVIDRIDFHAHCTPQHLLAIDPTKRSLIISDCEGYEMQLFTEEVMVALRNSDLLIEVHEHKGASLSSLIKILSNGHDVQVIDSVPDLLRAQQTTLPNAKNYPLTQRVVLMSELRSHRMYWILACPRKPRK